MILNTSQALSSPVISKPQSQNKQMSGIHKGLIAAGFVLALCVAQVAEALVITTSLGNTSDHSKLQRIVAIVEITLHHPLFCVTFYLNN